MINIKFIDKISASQMDRSDCGVACLLTLIQYYGGSSSLETLRKLSGTSRQGTTLLGLYQAALKSGFKAEGCEADISALIKHKQPVILHVHLKENLEHYIVCFGYENNRFIISDPAKGICYYSKDELENIWKSHTCLTLSPSNNFIKEKDVSSDRIKWGYHLIRKDFGLLGVSVIIGLVVAMLGMVIAVFSQKLVDQIIPEKNFKLLWVGIGLVLLLLITQIGLSALRQYLLFTQSKNFNNRIISFFYNKLLRLPKSFFDTRATGDLVARLNDTRRIQQVISIIASEFMINALSMIAALCMLFYYSWTIAIAILCCCPFFIYGVYRYNKPIIKAQREVMAYYAQSESHFINTMQGIDTIKNSNKQSIFSNLNRSIYGNFQNRIFDLGKININLSVFSGIISTFVITASIAYGSNLVLNNQLKIGELMAVITLVANITPTIIKLALVTIPLNEAKVAFNRMFEFVSIKPENDKGVSINERITSINIQELSFRFTGHKRILNQLNLHFCPGKLFFIIGESGCGKTTLCHIIEKSYFPEDGKIIINKEIDLGELSTNRWRKLVGIMPQEVYIFNGTVMDNICLGIESGNIDDVIKTCANYGIDEYIAKLPQGFATVVGEEGINLSGGQKQIIGLARLIVKNPQVMILDEPTSAMDRDMEQFALKILSSIKQEHIVIVVSHRLHIVKKYADLIYLIEDNTVYHSGTHEKMLQSENSYSKYWKDL